MNRAAIRHVTPFAAMVALVIGWGAATPAQAYLCVATPVSGSVSPSSAVGSGVLATFFADPGDTTPLGATISLLDFSTLGAFSTTACVPQYEEALGYSLLGTSTDHDVITSLADTSGALGTGFDSYFSGYHEADVASAISTIDTTTLGAFSIDALLNQYSPFGGSADLIGFSDGTNVGTVTASTASAVPLPGGLPLLFTGLIAMLTFARRRSLPGLRSSSTMASR